MKKQFVVFIVLILIYLTSPFSENERIYYKEKVKEMFYHAYNGYLENGYPFDELKPISCKGMNTWGSFSLSLIDSLDTLIIMGNYTEFERVVQIVLETINPDIDTNTSVFETNIRVVGGLLSAHLFYSKIPNVTLPEGWPCSGPLLDLAVKFADKLLPAFNTFTGMPYGTINLKYGVNNDETPITCTACIGTFIIEFGSLSKLTGNDIYEKVAMKALQSLWESRSKIGLVGNHINIMTGQWTATDAGIGAGVDSYYEYLAKGALLFQKPALMKQFKESVEVINQYVRQDDWFMWVSMSQGTLTFPYFQSLEAFYPGVLTLIGEIDDAVKIMLNYNHILRQYGLPPEFYNLNKFAAHPGREGFPLRPEVIESLMYIYRATNDDTYLEMGSAMVDAIEVFSKTNCGYATIKDISDGTIEDRMESFFLAETIKYLYLLFDKDNFIHNDGSVGKIVETNNGQCIIETGGYIFNTEAHPIDPGALYCCSKNRIEDKETLEKFKENISFLRLMNIEIEEDDDSEENIDIAHLSKELTELINLKKTKNLYLKRQYGDNPIEYEIDGVRGSVEEENKEDGEFEDFAIKIDNSNEEITNSTKVVTNGKIKKRPEGTNLSDIEELDNILETFEEYRRKKDTPSYKINLLSDRIKAYQKKFSELIKTTTIIYNQNLEEEIKRNKKKKEVSEMSQVQYLCYNCCWILDKRLDSFNLKAFLNEIYANYILKPGTFVIGPVCLHNDSPYPSDKYFNDITDLYDIPSFTQLTKAIDEIDFSKFKYHSLLKENYRLLTSKQRSFASLLTGYGQVMISE
uniref:alpha-1,2-Mannosidase n=1 Tax=Parastrongyloides trichosuri TaxID=131310 RepID=A0A0N4Z7B7_PARTI